MPAVGDAVQESVAEYLGRMADLTPATVDVIVDDIGPPPEGARAVPSRVAGLTRGTIATAPSVCRDCVWWQSRGNRTASKERWIERVEEESGEWGTIYYDDDGSVLGSMQYGPAGFFPRAADLPAGPPSDDAVLVTCAYLTGEGAEWVEKSLFLAAIGEARDQGAKALEAFAYRYPESETTADALPRPPHRVPARLPRGFRVRHRALAGQGRALPARADGPRAGRGRPSREGAPGRAGGVRPRRRARPAVAQRHVAVPASPNVPPGTGTNLQS